ncbi:hypothetical protein NE237_021117 [Protea cynaroides]|uniref:DOG1 domain-containing protein n=1 Tax=Protea cynaroides TaxID=273540 RepID=A0A9Q0H7D6_9MAGN|nr:hypothetical protein NE237_021117 [Protea cynaroides]
MDNVLFFNSAECKIVTFLYSEALDELAKLESMLIESLRDGQLHPTGEAIDSQSNTSEGGRRTTTMETYYEALTLAASKDVSQLLFPDWPNPMEQLFLWFGDLHPNLFTDLLRSFLSNDDNDDDDRDEGNFDRPLAFALAWKNPSEDLMRGVERIECGFSHRRGCIGEDSYDNSGSSGGRGASGRES